ncbi:MAG: C-type lectin domain-containing protein [Candidatus Hodarchaeota archaeon]
MNYRLCIFIGFLLIPMVVHSPITIYNVNGSESILTVSSKTNNSNYTVVDQYMTWEEARSYSESQDGHLVTITSSEEQDLVHSLIQGHDLGAWIGLTDEGIEGTWEWVTGEELIYTNWVDEGTGPNGTDYAMMHDGSGKWDGPFESEILPFVCEWSDYQDFQPNQTSTTIQNSNPELFTPLMGRTLLFFLFVGAILGTAYYNRKNA